MSTLPEHGGEQRIDLAGTALAQHGLFHENMTLCEASVGELPLNDPGHVP